MVCRAGGYVPGLGWVCEERKRILEWIGKTVGKARCSDGKGGSGLNVRGRLEGMDREGKIEVDQGKMK